MLNDWLIDLFKEQICQEDPQLLQESMPFIFEAAQEAKHFFLSCDRQYVQWRKTMSSCELYIDNQSFNRFYVSQFKDIFVQESLEYKSKTHMPKLEAVVLIGA